MMYITIQHFHNKT